MRNLIEKAKKMAADAHGGQVDKGGEAYIHHPIAVAGMVQGEAEKIVALLHDVVEDSPLTLADIRGAGFGEEIIAALDCITKRKGEAYDTYLLRVAGNDIARIVKLADLSHNMDVSRLKEITKKDSARLRKYAHAAFVLLGGSH